MIRPALSPHRDRFLSEAREVYPADSARDVEGLVDAAISICATDAPACRVLVAMLGAPGLEVDAAGLHAVRGMNGAILLEGDLIFRAASGSVVLRTTVAAGSWRVTVPSVRWPGRQPNGRGSSVGDVLDVDWITGVRHPPRGHQMLDRGRKVAVPE